MINLDMTEDTMHGSENVTGRLDAARRPDSFSGYGETDKHSDSFKHSLKSKDNTHGNAKFTDRQDTVRQPLSASVIEYGEKDKGDENSDSFTRDSISKDNTHGNAKFTDRQDTVRRPLSASVIRYGKKDKGGENSDSFKRDSISKATFGAGVLFPCSSLMDLTVCAVKAVDCYERKYGMRRSVAFTEDNDATVRRPLPTSVSGSEKNNQHNEKSSIYRPDSKVKETKQSELDRKFTKFKEKVVKNWIFVKENSNPFSWWELFKRRSYLSIKDFKYRDIEKMKIERRDLAELLLIKVLTQSVCKTEEDIDLVESLFLCGIGMNSTEKDHETSQNVSDDELCKECLLLMKNQDEWERCLNRQDIIKLKDHLLQESKITFEENEELVNDENYYDRNKKQLFSQLMVKIMVNLAKGSIQCFIQHAEHIVGQKQSGRIIMKKLKGQHESVQPAKKSSSIILQKEGVEEISKCKGQLVSFFLKMNLNHRKTGAEAIELYEEVVDKFAETNMISIIALRSRCDKISKGCVEIHFQPLDREMQYSFDFRFEEMIRMLLNEIDLENRIPCGEYTLTAEFRVSQSVKKPVADFVPSMDSIKFVTAEKSFLEEEIDTVAVFNGLQKRQRNIESVTLSHNRKDMARKLLQAIVDNNLEDDFISIVRECKMELILNRYETFTKVYSSDTACLRKNIICQFSYIIHNINIDDVREVLLNLRIIDESVLNGIVSNCEPRSDVAFATVILDVLESGDAIHAFTYALFLHEHNPFKDTVLPERQQICDEDFQNEVCLIPEEQSLLFKGCFKIVITDEETKTDSVKVLKDPSNNANKNIGTLMVYDHCDIDMNSDRPSTSQRKDDGIDKDDKKRYFIVASVYIELVTILFQQKLEENLKTLKFKCLEDFLNHKPVIHTLFHLRHRNAWCCTDKSQCTNHDKLPVTHQYWEQLYAENPGFCTHNCFCKYRAKSVKNENLDVSLCGLILYYCCSVGPLDGEAVHILRRNKNDYLSHNTTCGITKDEYSSVWNELKSNVLQLDKTKENELERIQDIQMDDALFDKYINIIHNINKIPEKIYMKELLRQAPRVRVKVEQNAMANQCEFQQASTP